MIASGLRQGIGIAQGHKKAVGFLAKIHRKLTLIRSLLFHPFASNGEKIPVVKGDLQFAAMQHMKAWTAASSLLAADKSFASLLAFLCLG